MSGAADLVTVVMPSFNQGRFIEAAARSVLDQDYRHLELLIVDAGCHTKSTRCLQNSVVKA